MNRLQNMQGRPSHAVVREARERNAVARGFEALSDLDSGGYIANEAVVRHRALGSLRRKLINSPLGPDGDRPRAKNASFVSDQALCFLAGANSIFSSDNGQMLTAAVPSPKYDADARLMELLGLRAMEPFQTKRGHTRFPHPQPPQLKS